MTNIIFWRHAEAEVSASSGLDVDRALTDKGRADAHHVARWLKKHLPKETQIFSSPALRCRQTLEALLALGNKKDVEQVEYSDALSISSHLQAIHQTLLQPPFESILLVGHQPLLGELVAGLLHTNPQSAQSYCIKKGSVWWLRHQHHRELSAQQSFEITGKMTLLTVQHPKFLK